MWKHNKVLVFILVIAINSCAPLPKTNAINNLVCMPPIVNFAYPVEGDKEIIQKKEVLPLGSWQATSTITTPVLVDSLEYNFLDIQFARQVKDETEIWIMSNWRAKSEDISHHSIYIYKTKSNRWLEVSGYIDNATAEIVNIYIDKNGDVWASAVLEIGYANGYIPEYSKTPYILGKFNEQENKFQALKFSQEIPLGPIDFDGEKFWIFEKDGAIFSLNPQTLETIKHIDPHTSEIAKYVDLPQNFIYSDDSLAFTDDGSFYFLDETPREYYDHLHVDAYYFNPKTNTLKFQPIGLEGGPPYFDLFVDQSGNLRVSDFGWMDKDGKWHQIIRSPLFITTKIEATPIYWERPKIILESNDGNLWFRSTNGIASLDPEKGEWCWFTTYQSNIVEDSDRNLWMIADNKLYKLPLSEQ